MVTEAKDPTKTITIAEGWANPANAFKKDGAYTMGYVLHAEQEYSGYGFNLPFGVKVNSVKVLSRLYGSTGDEIIIIKIYDGAVWHEKRIDKYTTPALPTTPTDIVFDFTGVTNWTAGKVNAIRTRIYYAYYIYVSGYIDNLTVEVDYSTVEEAEQAAQQAVTEFFKANWLPLSVLGVILAIVISIILGVW